MSYEKTITVLFYENGIEVNPFADVRMEKTANGFEIKIAPYDKVANNIGSVAFGTTFIISRNPPPVMVVKDEEGNEKSIINVSDNDVPILVEEDAIVYVTTYKRNHIRLVLANGKEILSKLGLDELEKLLSKDKFCRVHRSFIVSKKYIMDTGKPPRRKLTMADGKQINVTDGYEKNFVKWY